MGTRKMVLVALSMVLFAGCEQPTPGGKIPKEYGNTAKLYVGIYRGEIADSNGQLILALGKDNVVSLRYVGTEFLELKGCNTVLGRLEKVDVSKEGLESASFRLDQTCGGNKVLKLEFLSQRKLSATLVLSRHKVEHCTSLAEIRACERNGGENCDTCWDEVEEQSVGGHFER